MPTTGTRGTITVPPDVAKMIREKVRENYPDNPELADAPIGLLMRFAVLRFAGVSLETALRAARPLPRGRYANNPGVAPDWADTDA